MSDWPPAGYRLLTRENRDEALRDVFHEYRLARAAHLGAEAEREGAWFAYDSQARLGSPAPWKPLWDYYRQALETESAARRRLREAIETLGEIASLPAAL